jgi:hypothetical protein
MDINELALTVSSYLASVATAYGANVIHQLEEDGVAATADAAAGLGRRLMRRVMRAPAPAIEAAVVDVATYPGDEDFAAALRGQLRKALASDDALRADLAAMLGAVGGVHTVGGAHIHGNVTGGRVTIVGRDNVRVDRYHDE